MADRCCKSGWKGQRVVAFEDMPRSGADRNAVVFSTPRTLASGSYIGDLIQDRKDRARSRHAPRQLPLTALLKQETLEAMDWARKVGFTEEQVLYAAPYAVLVRRINGKGTVTAAFVRANCEKRYPHVFGEQVAV